MVLCYLLHAHTCKKNKIQSDKPVCGVFDLMIMIAWFVNDSAKIMRFNRRECMYEYVCIKMLAGISKLPEIVNVPAARSDVYCYFTEYILLI